MPYIILIAGLYLLGMSALFKTANFRSFLIFKAASFLLGLILLAHAVKLLGWLSFL